MNCARRFIFGFDYLKVKIYISKRAVRNYSNYCDLVDEDDNLIKSPLTDIQLCHWLGVHELRLPLPLFLSKYKQTTEL